MSNSSPLTVGSTLENRYEIVRELGQGGFGRTYLARDINRYLELCVLKEFAPQIQGANELQKAEELFEREASVLYKLQHSQIPNFRELLRSHLNGKQALFLIQDYIEGQSYAQVLKQRCFSEAEVVELLRQILPVLEYIHSEGVVHRDISPENLMLRTADKMPVLIDFGGVKKAATTAVSKATGRALVTLLGKEGYAPPEQIRQGKAFPSSDLYALAVTVLVLLSGKEPKELYDNSKAVWCWRQYISVSPELGRILDKCLAYRASDRYQSAREVLQFLLTVTNANPQPIVNPNPPPVTAGNPNISQMQTLNFVGRSWKTNVTQVIATVGKSIVNLPVKKLFGVKFLGNTLKVGVVVVAGVGAWNFAQAGLIKLPTKISFPNLPNLPNLPNDDATLSKTELERQAEIMRRSKALGVRNFYPQVDRLFYAKYPQLKGRALSEKAEDAKYRQRWCDIAEELLDQLEREKSI
ncbi:MAG: serine/threonine-protein kinase [Phormidium sp.]